MSFTTKEKIQQLIEDLLQYCWPKELGVLNIPFPVMTYKEAMAKYGVDKPDTRFGNHVSTHFLFPAGKQFFSFASFAS